MPICPVGAAPFLAAMVPLRANEFCVMRVPVEPSLTWTPAP